MSPAQHAFWNRAHGRIAYMQPAVARAVIRSLTLIVSALPEATLTRMITDGAIDRILSVLLAEAVLDRATVPLRLALRDAVERSYRLNIPYLPRGGRIDGTVAVFFDKLNPRVLEAMRTLESRVIDPLHDAVRTTTLQTISRGLEGGKSPAAIARTVRMVAGMPPSGEEAVANFRRLLEAGDREALTRLLRDRRFDRMLDRSLGKNGTGLTAEQVDRMVDAYRRKSLAAHAENVSSTATKEAYKIATRESWQSAIDRGIVDGDSLMREWIGIGDARERPGHLIMNNTVARFDEPYANGDTYAGEHDPHGCRCLDRFFVGRS